MSSGVLAMSEPPVHLIFEPWEDHRLLRPQPVVGTWSRTAWLPTLGPTSWLMWTELYSLTANGLDTITARDLGERIGISHRRVHAPLDRLERFGIVKESNPDYYAVRTSAGPLSPAMLRRRPDRVAGIQEDTFGRSSINRHLRSI